MKLKTVFITMLLLGSHFTVLASTGYQETKAEEQCQLDNIATMERMGFCVITSTEKLEQNIINTIKQKNTKTKLFQYQNYKNTAVKECLLENEREELISLDDGSIDAYVKTYQDISHEGDFYDKNPLYDGYDAYYIYGCLRDKLYHFKQSLK